MELTLDQALQKGVEAHKAGKAQEADRYYTAILKANPKHPDANHNMGVLAVGVGKVTEALPFFKTALEVNRKIDQYWLSYIDALIKLDRMADAKAVLDQAKSNAAKWDTFDQLEERLGSTSSKNSDTHEPPQEQLQSLINLHTQGQYQEVLNGASQLLLEFPKSVILFNIIGATNKGLGKLDEAIEAYNKALSLKPDYAEAHNNLGVALQEQGKLDEALEACTKAIFINPDYADAYYNMGIALQEQGKLDEAIEAYNKALSINPDYADAYTNMGNVLQEQSKLDGAIEAYNKALYLNPDYADAYYNMGNALKEQSKLDEAIEAYKKALSIKPDNSRAYNNMGISLQEKGKVEEAAEAYNKALSIKPDYAEAHRHLSIIKKYNEDDSQIVQAQELNKQEDLNDDARCSLSFALAKMYEDIGKLDQAFSHLSEGNALRKKLLKYSINQDKKLFTQLKKTQPHLLKNSLKIKEGSIESTPIFIVGMPRSGTTLVEQIMSSHSNVIGAGELDHVSKFGGHLVLDPTVISTSAISEFRKRYLSEVSKLSKGKHFITDKMPQNFHFIPLICAALPEAKIIHVQRSATATCWSNYKQFFTSKNLGYCYDLSDLITYYELYADLMKFWQTSYCDKIYHLNYEKLTTKQENETRKLINYLELDWEDACLSPHKNKRSVRTASQQQVRQKVYKGSSEAWRKYEPYLNGAFDSLPSL